MPGYFYHEVHKQDLCDLGYALISGITYKWLRPEYPGDTGSLLVIACADDDSYSKLYSCDEPPTPTMSGSELEAYAQAQCTDANEVSELEHDQLMAFDIKDMLLGPGTIYIGHISTTFYN